MKVWACLVDIALEHSCLECLLTNFSSKLVCHMPPQLSEHAYDPTGFWSEMHKRSLCWNLSSGPQVLPLMIFYLVFPKWKKGSVQRALQAFQAISLLPYPALVLFSEYSNTWWRKWTVFGHYFGGNAEFFGLQGCMVPLALILSRQMSIVFCLCKTEL